MLTLSDIENAVFRRSGRAGYNGEDVDNFLQQIRVSYEALIKNNLEQKEKIAMLSSENASLKKENTTLSSQIQQYRDEEDEIKHALISAQKLGDASIREARHKAEIILKDAELQAQSVVAEARGKIGDYETELEQLKRSVSDFRASLLDMYRKHLVLIDALPSQRTAKKEEKPAPAEVEPATAPEKPEQPSPQAEAEPVAPQQVPEEETKAVAQKEPVEEKPEKEYTDVSGFGAPEPRTETKDRRYGKLKFGDDYDIAQDPDSPVDIFNR